MYGSEPLRTSLFVFSMQQTNLLAMFDPSMLGEENLVAQLKDIDENRCYFIDESVSGLISTQYPNVYVRRPYSAQTTQFQYFHFLPRDKTQPLIG